MVRGGKQVVKVKIKPFAMINMISKSVYFLTK